MMMMMMNPPGASFQSGAIAAGHAPHSVPHSSGRSYHGDLSLDAQEFVPSIRRNCGLEPPDPPISKLSPDAPEFVLVSSPSNFSSTLSRDSQEIVPSSSGRSNSSGPPTHFQTSLSMDAKEFIPSNSNTLGMFQRIFRHRPDASFQQQGELPTLSTNAEEFIPSNSNMQDVSFQQQGEPPMLSTNAKEFIPSNSNMPDVSFQQQGESPTSVAPIQHEQHPIAPPPENLADPGSNRVAADRVVARDIQNRENVLNKLNEPNNARLPWTSKEKAKEKFLYVSEIVRNRKHEQYPFNRDSFNRLTDWQSKIKQGDGLLAQFLETSSQRCKYSDEPRDLLRFLRNFYQHLPSGAKLEEAEIELDQKFPGLFWSLYFFFDGVKGDLFTRARPM